MPVRHRNKTFATLLAALTGGLGLHRFYLRGWGDKWGWLHVSSIPVAALALMSGIGQHVLFQAGALVLSVLCGFLEALVLGLMPDDKWDRTFNSTSGKTSASAWPLALLLVLTLGLGGTVLIAVIARSFDLILTGGAFG